VLLLLLDPLLLLLLLHLCRHCRLLCTGWALALVDCLEL
jgi:hypothetical protein